MYPKFWFLCNNFWALYNFRGNFETDTVCPEAGVADSVETIRKAILALDQIPFGEAPTHDLGDVVIEDEAEQP
jgi:hypothetical protein